MKKQYRIGEDIFIVLGVILIGVSIILKLFDTSLGIGLTKIQPRAFLNLATVFLLLSMALNIQELMRK